MLLICEICDIVLPTDEIECPLCKTKAKLAEAEKDFKSITEQFDFVKVAYEIDLKKIVKLQADLTASKEQMAELKGTLDKCVEPMLRYQSCLKSNTEQSAHDGKRDNQKFWEERTRRVAVLQEEIKQVLKGEKE